MNKSLTTIQKSIARKFVLLLCVLISVACAKMEDPSLNALHDATYLGKGSAWQFELKANGTFSATQKESYQDQLPLLTVNGSYELIQASGYYLFTVLDAEGIDAPQPGDQAVGLAIPGVMLIVKPIGGDSNETLVMPAIGECPSDYAKYNWVQAKTAHLNHDLNDSDLWGNATIPDSGVISGRSFQLDGTLRAEKDYAIMGSCQNGIFEIEPIEADDAGGYGTVTSAGIGIVSLEREDQEDDEAIISLPQDQYVSEATFRSKEFSVLIFMGPERGVKAGKITFDENSDGQYVKLDDVHTENPVEDEEEQAGITIQEVGAGEKAGFVKLVVSTENPDETPVMWAAVNSNINSSGKAFFMASGFILESPEKSFSVVGIEK